MTPWTDRAGRFSALKAAVFAGTLAPALWLAQAALTDQLGAKPVDAAIHFAGEWAIRFLIASLAVTPLRKIAAWARLVQVRRMLGVAAPAYAGLHLALYAASQDWNLSHVASEIVSRIYLLIGFVALLGLAALGATSTDAAVRRLRKNWGRLHKLAYPIAMLAALHFFMQSKADAGQATLIAGLFVLLMAYRGLDGARRLAVPPALAVATLALTALAAGAATMGLEYAWYALGTTLPAERVFLANFDAQAGLRPAAWVMLAGLAVAALPPLRAGIRKLPAIRPRSSAGPAAGRP